MMETRKVEIAASITSDYHISTITEDDPPSSSLDNAMDKKAFKGRIHWWFAPTFLLFWLMLLVAVVMPVFLHLPEGYTLANEHEHPGEFIAERAQRILHAHGLLGPKVTGTFANENQTVQLLFDEIEKIREQMHEDLFDMEVDLQVASGAYMHWNMVNMYQGLQNVVVRFKSKSSTSNSYFLINSHFDSSRGSPGAGDDGVMMVVMLEALRAMATTRQTFTHPILFLFNGAEENPLQASHAFITQHKWASNCKALINLDSAGNGNREILFQSGPNNPWLMNYYDKNVKRPFATTLAEEIFQADLIPSDTDFRIFRDFGGVPGLDFAHSYNGYVYHTKFDRFSVVPRGTIQATGDNILALLRAFADAPEVEDPTPFAEGHTVFYDYLGGFFIYYTETTGKIINTCVSVIALALVGVSLWRMTVCSESTPRPVLREFGLILLLHFVAFLLAFMLPALMAIFYDSDDRTMTWFTNKWLILGLYVCPTLFGLSAPTLYYIHLRKHDKLSLSYRLQMIFHAYTVILALICIIITFMGIRSSYLLMISLFFYACTLLLNLGSKLHDRGFYWTILHMVGQVMPFIYYAYLFYAFLCTTIPMMGRNGINTNPDMYIGLLTALGVVLAMGYLIPLMNMFRFPKLGLACLLIVMFVFNMLSLTPLGFPYRAKTNVARMVLIDTRRVIYDFYGSVTSDESGYYMDFEDRRNEKSVKGDVNFDGLELVTDKCDSLLMCGLPVFNHRMGHVHRHSWWLPREKPIQLPATPYFKMLNKTVNPTLNTVRFEFVLSGPPHTSIFIRPRPDCRVIDWTFIKTALESGYHQWKPPYHIYFTYGKDNSPLNFFVELRRGNGNFDEPVMELGIGAHYVGDGYKRDPESQRFVDSFPDYAFVLGWPSSYQIFWL